MANTSNSSLSTNFNVYPYYDDYRQEKNYYRILYKPGYAVQARELTQSQTMMQKQIDRFGKHVFKEGSLVLPEKAPEQAFFFETDLNYVKIKDVDSANNDINASDFINLTLTGATNNIKALVVETEEGLESDANTKTLFVTYQSGSSVNTDIKVFQSGETLVSSINSNPVVISSGTTTGKGTRFVIREGVLFAKEHFIYYPQQSIVVDRYSTQASAKVGFTIVESIVSAADDASLLDPALESSNFSAPGADRLKLTPTLEIRDVDETSSPPDFVPLAIIKNGVVTQAFTRSLYNIIGDEMAKRTYDESGDYYVRGLGVRVRENLNTGTNGGYSNTGSANLLSVGVEPGLGYVKGYEVNKSVTDYITTDKGIDSIYSNNQISTSTMGNYVTLREITGVPIADKGTLIQLYDTASGSITNKTFDAQPTGNVIGTARITSFEYGLNSLGSADGQIYLYLNDIKMNGTNTFSQVKTVYLDNSGTVKANLVADVVLSSTNTAIINDTTIPLLYETGSLATKTVRSPDGSASLQFNTLRTSDVTITGGTGLFTITLSSAGPDDEIFPYGTTSGLSDSDKNEFILTINDDTTITGSGTVSGTAGTPTLNGSSANFERLNVGDKIQVQGHSNTFIISAIANNDTLTITENLPAGISGNTYAKVYKSGDIVNLTGKGFASGVERSVATTPTSITFDLKETYSGDLSGTVTYQVVRRNAAQVAKELRPSRFVKINVASSSAGVTGPYNLGISDVYKIRSIRKKSGSFPTSTSDGTNAINEFVFNNGQKDLIYDHASITPTTTLTSDSHLLIELDFFEPDFTLGRGYFTVDSYPIDDTTESSTTIKTEQIPLFTSPRSKKIYDLRNFIDLRPVKAATANTSATSVAGATINPASPGNFTYVTTGDAGLRIMAPSTQFTYDFSYYLPRRDLVVLDETGIVRIVRGTPTIYPVTPSTPSNVMALASIFITPFPSLAPNYGKTTNRPDLTCVVKKMSNVRHTMREIGLMKKRIENLEYYASLSLLEKEATDLKVLDENGLERFKNGIFVDTFSNHSLGDTRNLNYRIVVDPAEKVIRPYYTMTSVYYDYKTGSNVRKTGDLITLNYTEVPLITQNVATSDRNVELTSYRFLGEAFMLPDTDVWVDTEWAPDEAITVGNPVDPAANGVIVESLGVEWGEYNYQWNTHQTQITGYEAYNGRGELVGTYATLAEAQKPFDNDYGYILASANTEVFFGSADTSNPNQPSGSVGSWFYPSNYAGAGTYGYVTNVTINGKFHSVYNLTKGDGIIYATYSGSQTGTATRTGTETFSVTTVEATTSTEQVDTKLIDVSLHAYIRPQTVKVYVRGLKPFTRVRIFFDSENITNNSRPITQSRYLGTVNPDLVATPSIWSSPITTDVNGEAFFEFRILPGQFRVGTKELVVTDSLTNSVDATTKAVAYFVSHGLVQQKQNTILTTHGYTTSTTTETRTVSESIDAANTAGTTSVFIGFVDDASCSAYSFVPKAPAGEEGIFLTSVELYFSRKHPNLGVWFEVREMDSAGGITRNQVPFSEVSLSAAEINVSDDASSATKVTFPSPLFLYNDVQYAFVIHTVGLNPDTFLWIARLGEDNINTGDQYTSRPLTGTFYTTNNNLNWDIVPDIDLKIKFNRASFTTGVTGQAILGNKPVENLLLGNVSSRLSPHGEVYYGRTRITCTGNTANIQVGDYLVGANSGANATVLSINGSVVTLANTQYEVGEVLEIRYGANAALEGVNTVATSIDIATGFLKRYKDRGDLSVALGDIEGSNGKFVVGDTLTGQDSGYTATVDGVRNFRYSVADFEPAYLNFNKTTIGFEMKTTSNTEVAGDYIQVNDNENYYFTSERALMSRTRELSELSGSPSNNVRISMESSTEFLSPVIDLSRTHTVYIDNIINANTYKEDATGLTLTLSGNTSNISVSDNLEGLTTGGNVKVLYVSGNTVVTTPSYYRFLPYETVNILDSNYASKSNTSVIQNIIYDRKKPGGALINKYISIPITLAEGQDAEDLLVMLTAYRPPGTDVKVWAKIQHVEDTGSVFEELPWLELVTDPNAPYSSLSNLNDFREISYRFPAEMRVGSENGEIQYLNNDGILFTGFKTYAIKIGLLGTNSAIIPRVGDLRTIALQI